MAAVLHWLAKVEHVQLLACLLRTKPALLYWPWLPVREALPLKDDFETGVDAMAFTASASHSLALKA